jgi:predicted kinase
MKNKPTVFITKGLPGSGKSTWAKQWSQQFKRVSSDDLRAMLDNGKWTSGNEKYMLRVRDMLILQAIEEGKDVCVDATNLHPKHEVHTRALVGDKAEVEIEDFTDVPLEECIKRDLQRPHPVGEKVIRDMYNKYLKPVPPTVEYNSVLPDCIICDIDGTLAFNDWRNPYDASECEKDGLNTPVRDIIMACLITPFGENGLRLILVSGRQDEYKKQTERWLSDNNIPYDALHMRKAGDTRKDSIIKQEIYEAHIKGQYNVLYVFDDRNQTVDMWRDLGLTCLQVAPGDF